VAAWFAVRATWQQCGEILPYSAVSTAVVLLHGRHLDVLSVGDEEAARSASARAGPADRGGRVRAAAASAVAVSGLIGFVGIIVPHVSAAWPAPPTGWSSRCRCWPARAS